MVIIGIDTDAKGSLALLDCRNRNNIILDIYAIPNRHKLLTGGTKRLEIDYPAFAAILLDLISTVHVDRLYLEDQWSRPNQASGATFTFGKTFGDCRTASAAALLATGLKPEEVDKKIVYVSGADWKHVMRLGKDKKLSLNMANALFPSCSHAWKLVSKHTSAAEAALLALYGATAEGVRFKPGVVVKPPGRPISIYADTNLTVRTEKIND